MVIFADIYNLRDEKACKHTLHIVASCRRVWRPEEHQQQHKA
jgi:hypothetical protein